MACVEKLLLRGIRSFGPEDRDEAKLKFCMPLTIILGQNGCGKTTIIEALKYATCGDMPSNCNQGAGFVHDPKLCNCTEVRGQVKLQVRDLKGKTLVIARSIQTTQKAKKLQFKTLDQTITRKDQAGQDVSISGRCADIDAEMCVALGVSKAILNSVIFCHQEDSHWPLDEGKKLKERFDLIFETVKYNKCLDSVKLQRSILSSDIKMNLKELENLEERKKEVAEKKTRLSEEEGRMNVIQDRVAEYENELGPIKKRMGELVSREMDISRLITERATKSATLKAIQSSISEYEQGITSEFQGSLEELKLAIQNFKSQFSQQESKLEGLQAELSREHEEEQRLTRLINSEQMKLGQLTRDQEQNCERVQQRNKALSALSEQLQLSSNVLTEGDVVRSLGSIERAIRAAEADVESLRESGEENERILQEKIDSLREEKTKLEQSRRLKNQLIHNNKEDTKKLKLEIDEVNQSTEKLNRLQKQLEKVQKSADDLNKAVDSDQMEKDIKDSETRRDKWEDELAVLDKEVRQLQEISQLQTELNIQKDAKALKEAEIRKLKNKTEDSLLHLLGNIPETGIKHQLQSCIDRLAHDMRTKQSKIVEKQRQLTTLEADRKHLREKHKEKTRVLSQDQEELYDACENRDYEAVLADVTSQLLVAQDDKGTLKASEFMFGRYVEKLKRDEPCCPLCHRGFQEVQESQELITELEGRMQGLPRMIEEKERELEQLQERQSRLQQLRPTYQRISKLKNEEIPALQSQIEATETRLEATRQELTTLQTDLVGPQTDEAMAKNIQGDVALLDQQQNELRKLEREVNKLQERLPQGGSGRNLKDALSEQDKLHKEVQMLRKSLQSLQERRNRHNQQLHQLQSEKNSIVEQQLKIQGGVQQKKQLEDKLCELQAQEIVLLEEFDQITDQIQPVSDRLEAAIREKEQARLAHKQKLDTERNRVNKLVRQCDDVRKIQESITKYEKSGGADRLSATKQTITRLAGDKETVLENKKQLQDQINEVKTNLNNQQVRQRELDDNLKLRQKREEEKGVNEEILALSTKIGGMDLQKVIKEKEDLRKREETILRDKAHTEGRRRELQENIQLLRKELNKDNNKNADKAYSDAVIELKVKEVANEDLGHYYKALDWALSHFHNQRMKHINDIIGDLWTQIYCGNDIDTIKIKIDEDKSEGEKKRKVYNYRVVQVKNGQELDMRGRCSAGQKMLACLIIRMALAEIFSSKCGILTLDEPTTNLDKDNIDRLCATLANLISLRASQKSNFQLIVITHDEDFIDKLTKMHKVDYYFSVSRNDRGKSLVTTVRCD
ncbi:DNA repair protein RAD50 isoform X1 [Homalodisca vitripennis]|uniref:DNA repair protein RAD50 isoform X1 n=1 Tax=Homalodisca vitripennis TaxID=197043 RepID=UPI001EEBE661|nr:DNA repair protein RAD50 isoform X1 [Homalodisca vitripennis]XP_046664940.1 DNA repair protein RAD50 isoform X1 [Homalodisca vitripennis]XP_046664941.1 DNA repair protein RAD50 isoform X1 [Homalodisca vitripennis]XP_046664942.1 DNA repair protein RAD50 isoform X1 [Homalodisca vitripennis]